LSNHEVCNLAYCSRGGPSNISAGSSILTSYARKFVTACLCVACADRHEHAPVTAFRTVGGKGSPLLVFLGAALAAMLAEFWLADRRGREPATLNRPQFAGGSKVSMDGAYGKK
jgi:hypothetical protein